MKHSLPEYILQCKCSTWNIPSIDALHKASVSRETMDKVYASKSVPRETMGKVYASKSVPRETMGKIYTSKSVPRETMGKVYASKSVPRETMGKVYASKNVPRETFRADPHPDGMLSKSKRYYSEKCST